MKSLSLLPWLLALFGMSAAYGLDSDTGSSLTTRLQKTLSPLHFVDVSYSKSFSDVVADSQRSAVELRLARNMPSGQYMAGYNVQFNRRNQSGVEHRVWQQFRLQKLLARSTWDNTARIEARHFAPTDESAGRLRFTSRWSKPVGGGNTVRMAYEWTYNLTDQSRQSLRGVGQNRLVGSLSHAFSGGKRVDVSYGLGYINISGNPNRIQHQLSLTWFCACSG